MSNNSGEVSVIGSLSRANTLLTERQEEFAQALAGRIDPKRFVKVALTTIAKSPSLLDCTPASLLMAVTECASLGLEPSGVMGEAYIIPYGVREKVGGRWQVVRYEAQLQLGYRGLIKLATRSGEVLSIVPRTVYEHDTFDYALGLNEKLLHIPARPSPDHDAGRPIAYYAIARMKNGRDEFWVRDVHHIEKIKRVSKTSTDRDGKAAGPWKDWEEPMAWKTVIREFVKYLPIGNAELVQGIELDDRDIDLSRAATVRPVDRLNGALGAGRQDPVQIEAAVEAAGEPQDERKPEPDANHGSGGDRRTADDTAASYDAPWQEKHPPSSMTPEEREEYGLDNDNQKTLL